ncbi:hypothetical protein EYF80_003417 [Liparis tanakae]|uniref:Uncharacterized protein n=1 Tax=Liparis tanakae TaxID=230148 RepID=A0A4Z2JAB3_9TELE|nr:hypothetical protein EYF80_003417 [Liparis tanakae]
MPESSKQHPDGNHAQKPVGVSQRNALRVWTHESANNSKTVTQPNRKRDTDEKLFRIQRGP